MTFIMLSYPTLPKSAKRCFAQQLERYECWIKKELICEPLFFEPHQAMGYRNAFEMPSLERGESLREVLTYEFCL